MTISTTNLTQEEIDRAYDDPAWRISNLYYIIVKGDDDQEGLVMKFKPNRAQRRLITRLWHRNVILKARQLGFTTLIALLWLDTALFSKDPVRCGIIAQDREAAEAIFRDKVKFAYNNLDPGLKVNMPLERDSATELLFGHNGSSIRVATSMRSGTIHRLHVSEFGKIAAKFPDKAREVVTGSIPAVPKSGLLVIESTAEGQEGPFYEITQAALAKQESGTKLNAKDYRFHFFAWWNAPEYQLDPRLVIFTESDLRYFAEVEAKIGRRLKDSRRAWYVATRNSDFQGDPTLMWQEYPSYPEEAFQVSTEGCYYATNLAQARKEGRILTRIPVEAAPVNTFWDLGLSDETAIWFHQRIGMENRFLRYYEASGEGLDHYAKYLQNAGYTFGRHYVPHDAEHKRLGINADTNRSIKEMLEGLLPGQVFQTVPRITDVHAGITATRNVFASCWFDETGCKDGLARLQNYRKEWNARLGAWSMTPRHDSNSNGSDAFRQFGQEADNGNKFPAGMVSWKQATGSGGGWKRRRGGMAV